MQHMAVAALRIGVGRAAEIHSHAVEEVALRVKFAAPPFGQLEMREVEAEEAKFVLVVILFDKRKCSGVEGLVPAAVEELRQVIAAGVFGHQSGLRVDRTHAVAHERQCPSQTGRVRRGRAPDCSRGTRCRVHQDRCRRGRASRPASCRCRAYTPPSHPCRKSTSGTDRRRRCSPDNCPPNPSSPRVCRTFCRSWFRASRNGSRCRGSYSSFFRGRA